MNHCPFCGRFQGDDPDGFWDTGERGADPEFTHVAPFCDEACADKFHGRDRQIFFVWLNDPSNPTTAVECMIRAVDKQSAIAAALKSHPTLVADDCKSQKEFLKYLGYREGETA